MPPSPTAALAAAINDAATTRDHVAVLLNDLISERRERFGDFDPTGLASESVLESPTRR